MISYIDTKVTSNQKQKIRQQNEKTKSEHIMRLYQSILSIIPEGIAVINSEKKLLYANPTLKKILQSKNKSEIVQVLMNLGNNSSSGVQSCTPNVKSSRMEPIPTDKNNEIMDSNMRVKSNIDQTQKSKMNTYSPKVSKQALNTNNNQQATVQDEQSPSSQNKKEKSNQLQEQCSIVEQKCFADSQRTLKQNMHKSKEIKEETHTKQKSQTSISNFNYKKDKETSINNNNNNSIKNIKNDKEEQAANQGKVEDESKYSNSKNSSINKVSSMNISKEQIKSQYSQKSSRIIKKGIRRDSRPEYTRKLKTLYVKESTNQSLNNYQSDQSEILSYQGFGFNIGEDESEYVQKPKPVQQNFKQRGSDSYSNKANQAENSPRSMSRSSAIKKKSFSITPSSSFSHSAQRYTRKKFTALHQSQQISENQIKNQQQYEMDRSIQFSQPPPPSNITQQQFTERTFNDSPKEYHEKKETNGNSQEQPKQSEFKIRNSSEFNINIFTCKQDEIKLEANPSIEQQLQQLPKFGKSTQQQISNQSSGLKLQPQLKSNAFSSNVYNSNNTNERIKKQQASYQTIFTNKQKESSSSTIPFTLKVKTRKNLSQSKIDNKITLTKTDVSNIIDKMLQSSPKKKKNNSDILGSCSKIRNESISHQLEINERGKMDQTTGNLKRGSFISQLKKNEDQVDLSYVQQTDTVTKIQVKYKNRDLVLQFLTVDVLTENQKKDPLVMIMVQDLWQDLYQKKVQDIQKDKMRIFASLSHELRTPLNCSISMLEVLKDEIGHQHPEYIDEYLNPALFSSKLLLNQINDILDFVQMDSGKFKYSFLDFNIMGLLKDCSRLVSMQAQMKNIQLKLFIQQGIPEIICSDPNRIRQIILNFLSNSLKFTKKGSIEIGVIPYDDNGLYEVYVKDTGIGITKENLNTIFQFCNKINYNQKDEGLNSQGCGLGLTISNSIAKGLVTEVNNTESGVKVKSDYGKGSTFSIVIQNMNYSKDDKIREVTESLQIELLKQSKGYEQSKEEEMSPGKRESRQRLSILKNSGSRKSLMKRIPSHLVSPSQIIIEDEPSIFEQNNTSVDYLKHSYFKNNMSEFQVDREGSYSPERKQLKPSSYKGANHFDSAVIMEFDEESSQDIKIHSNISIKNNIDRFQEDDSNYQKELQNSNMLSKPQMAPVSQYKYPICKSPLKQLKSQFTYDHHQKSETFNNLTSENITSNRVIGNNMVYGVQEDSKSELETNLEAPKKQGICSNFTNQSKKQKTNSSIQQTELEKSYQEQEGFTSYVGFTKYVEGQQSSRVLQSSLKNVEKFQQYKSAKSQSIAVNYDESEYEDQKNKKVTSNFELSPTETIDQIIQYNIQKKQRCDCPQIMIVDDNQFNLYALAKVVQQFQFSCIQVSDGAQAVEDIKIMCEESCCKAPKIIFMDIEMPLKNGYETAIEITQFYEEIQFDKIPAIIACTAYVGQEDHDKALKAGMDDFINKPILKNAFQQLMLNWQNLFL